MGWDIPRAVLYDLGFGSTFTVRFGLSEPDLWFRVGEGPDGLFATWLPLVLEDTQNNPILRWVDRMMGR